MIAGPGLVAKGAAAWLVLLACCLVTPPAAAEYEVPGLRMLTLLSARVEPATVIDVDIPGRTARFQRPDGEIIETVLARSVRHLNEAKPGRLVTIQCDEILVVQQLPHGRRGFGALPNDDFLRFRVVSVDYEIGRAWLVGESGGEVRAYYFAAFTWDEDIERVNSGDVLEGILIRALVDVFPAAGVSVSDATLSMGRGI
jgi:hypothetical protein